MELLSMPVPRLPHPDPEGPYTMEVLLRQASMVLPVENFGVLLVSKRKTKVNTVLVQPDVFCAIFLSLLLCFQHLPVGSNSF